MINLPTNNFIKKPIKFFLKYGILLVCIVASMILKNWWPIVAALVLVFLINPNWWSIPLASVFVALAIHNWLILLIGIAFAVLGKPKRWWPAYAGIGFALVQLMSFLLSGRPLGATRGLTVIGAIAETLAIPDHAESVNYWSVYEPVIDWTIALLVGVWLGSLISSRYSGDFKLNAVPEFWKLSKGPSVLKRWIWAFIGGAMIGFAARIAGGCASGLLISGVIQMAPSGFIFMFAIWIGGLFTTLVFYRTRSVVLKRDKSQG
ncbi:MAG: YeeE/YedE family protein [Nitrospirae bacterium]|nr:YeeE/YedE family protein [Nitrospirota bacterium]MBF0539914.1 YeeE/YedE family protein [Nitrospirota bacterium]